MKMESITKTMNLVDENGIIRKIEITVKREPSILVEISVRRYIDENGIFKNVIGQLVPTDTVHERWDGFAELQQRVAHA